MSKISTHRTRVSLAQLTFCWWRHNRFLMTSQWPNDCYASTWKVISYSLDIDFIHRDIHGWSWKKNRAWCASFCCRCIGIHDDVIKWKHFPRYWPFVRGIHRPPANSLHKGQWRGTLMFYLICALNKRLNNQSGGWWFETPTRSLWRHCNVLIGSCDFFHFSQCFFIGKRFIVGYFSVSGRNLKNMGIDTRRQ